VAHHTDVPDVLAFVYFHGVCSQLLKRNSNTRGDAAVESGGEGTFDAETQRRGEKHYAEKSLEKQGLVWELRLHGAGVAHSSPGSGFLLTPRLLRHTILRET